MLYMDIHTHQSSEFPEEEAIVNTIVDEREYALLQQEMQRQQGWQSAGIHPWYIYNVRAQLEKLQMLVETLPIVAIGEAGLDKLCDTPMDWQQEAFRQQVQMAEDYQKPLIVHCVKAWPELIAVKKQLRPVQPWIIHGFRGNGVLASQLIAQGCFLSFGAKYNPLALQAAWPLHLLAETDESPINIRMVYDSIAKSLHITLEELAQQIESQLKSRIFARML